ncbi:hypothetical protein V5279_23880 [Bradyrhizobium sp. 26S5]|uniref:hypothetical protein n=1 Tax=Bradyrhizobium sp. 26S5 TaxID=3139729 RepID=UPI0030CF4FA9
MSRTSSRSMLALHLPGVAAALTANASQTSVPTTGSKSIATGDDAAFAVQMTAKGGSDSITVQCASVGGIVGVMPTVTTGAVYSNTNQVPNVVIVASDGTLGYFFGGYVANSATTQTWSSSDTIKEYGNLIIPPFPVKVYGVILNAAFFGNTDAILYSNPLVTPVAEKTKSIDLNAIGSATAGPYPRQSKWITKRMPHRPIIWVAGNWGVGLVTGSPTHPGLSEDGSAKPTVLQFQFDDRDPIVLAIVAKEAVAIARSILDQYENPPPSPDRYS